MYAWTLHKKRRYNASRSRWVYYINPEYKYDNFSKIERSEYVTNTILPRPASDVLSVYKRKFRFNLTARTLPGR